jgi:hypothetical protein
MTISAPVACGPVGKYEASGVTERGGCMGNKRKQSARAAFDLNIEDAKMLVEFARLLSNQRRRRMRIELRERLGSALDIPQRQRDDLDCLQNDRAFMIFMPGHASWRERLDEASLRPLLRLWGSRTRPLVLTWASMRLARIR